MKSPREASPSVVKTFNLYKGLDKLTKQQYLSRESETFWQAYRESFKALPEYELEMYMELEDNYRAQDLLQNNPYVTMENIDRMKAITKEFLEKSIAFYGIPYNKLDIDQRQGLLLGYPVEIGDSIPDPLNEGFHLHYPKKMEINKGKSKKKVTTKQELGVTWYNTYKRSIYQYYVFKGGGRYNSVVDACLASLVKSIYSL